MGPGSLFSNPGLFRGRGCCSRNLWLPTWSAHTGTEAGRGRSLGKVVLPAGGFARDKSGGRASLTFWLHPVAYHLPEENQRWAWSEPGGYRAKWQGQLLQPICSSVSFPAAFLISKACGHLNLLLPALLWGHLCGGVPEGSTHGLPAPALKVWKSTLSPPGLMPLLPWIHTKSVKCALKKGIFKGKK